MRIPIVGPYGVRHLSKQGQESIMFHRGQARVGLPAGMQENLGHAASRSLCPCTVPGSCFQGGRRFWVTAGYWHLC